MRRPFIFLALPLALHGCAYHRLVVASGEAPDQRYHAVNSEAIGWGASEQQTVASQCPTNLLSEVRTRTSLWQSLATVVTLGIWQGARIEYRCAKLPVQAGEIEP
jgi:hypothetical protein